MDSGGIGDGVHKPLTPNLSTNWNQSSVGYEKYLVKGRWPEVVDRKREVKQGYSTITGTKDQNKPRTGTALYGTVRTVVWGNGEGNPTSYAIIRS